MDRTEDCAYNLLAHMQLHVQNNSGQKGSTSNIVTKLMVEEIAVEGGTIHVL
jgi:hypothetical protein